MSIVIPHTTLIDLHGRLLEAVPRRASVLDVGAGLAKYHALLVKNENRLTLLDAHLPYLEDRAANFPTAMLIHGEALAELRKMNDGAFDVALAIDFIEHLNAVDAAVVSHHLQRVARKVVLFVPEGNHPQTTDGYNMGGDHWQTHRSSWDAGGLERFGYTVERWVDFHTWAKSKGCDAGALWATWSRP